MVFTLVASVSSSRNVHRARISPLSKAERRSSSARAWSPLPLMSWFTARNQSTYAVRRRERRSARSVRGADDDTDEPRQRRDEGVGHQPFPFGPLRSSASRI